MSALEIELQLLTKKDSKQLNELFSDERVLESYPFKALLNQKQSDDFLNRITTNGCWTWKILKPKDNFFLGICSLHHYNEINKTIEIGGTLFSNHWEKGIMFIAFKKLIERAEQDFYVKRIIGKTRQSNTKAIGLVKKLAFSVSSTENEEVILVKHLSP